MHRYEYKRQAFASFSPSRYNASKLNLNLTPQLTGISKTELNKFWILFNIQKYVMRFSGLGESGSS